MKSLNVAVVYNDWCGTKWHGGRTYWWEGGGFVRRVETGGKQETDFRDRWEMEGGPKDRWEAEAWATR